MLKCITLIVFLFSISLQPIERKNLKKILDKIDLNPSMTVTLYFQGYGQFASNGMILHSKSGPASAEDIIEEIEINDLDLRISYTNRGKGAYFNDLYISIFSISMIHVTKYSVEIYIGSPKLNHGNIGK
jgi:hypothetical protein